MFKQFVRNKLHGDHSGFWKFVIVSSVVMLLFLLFARGNNLYRWAQAGYKISSQESQIEKYNNEIAAMNDSIRLLKSNRDSLEKYARETFYFSAPGEDVFMTGE